MVAINSDESIKRLKGNSKPIIPEWQRIRVLQSLRRRFFMELAFLWSSGQLKCVKNNLKVVYDPSIQVVHTNKASRVTKYSVGFRCYDY